MAEQNSRAPFPSSEAIISVLARNWWALAIRGVLGILFGLIALFLPGATMLSLVWLFAAYAFLDGIFGIASAIRSASREERWGALLLEGIVDIAAAVVAVLWPGITVLAFVLLVAFWAMSSGAFMLSAAFRFRFEGRWWLGFAGLISVIYGAALIIAPAFGALVLTWWLGAYVLIFGATLVAFAFRLRGLKENIPTGGATSRKFA